jgi:hypothetical protein
MQHRIDSLVTENTRIVATTQKKAAAPMMEHLLQHEIEEHNLKQ